MIVTFNILNLVLKGTMKHIYLDLLKYRKYISSLLSFYFYLCEFRAEEVKEHPFFNGLDWQQVYMQKYPPPLVPPRGEVNAADAFDIGSFDEEDTKGIKVCVHMLYLI